jgi:hypothetical protein
MPKRNMIQFNAFVQAYATGTTTRDFCKQKHLKYDTVRKWSCEPAFKKAVAALQAELYEAFVGHLTGAMKEAAEGLVEIARRGSPDSVRLAAWRGIVDDLFKVRSVSKLEGDLAAMNERLAQLEQGEADAKRVTPESD